MIPQCNYLILLLQKIQIRLSNDKVSNSVPNYLLFITTICTSHSMACWCLMPLSTIFKLYDGGQFYWCKTPNDPEKTTDLSRVLIATVGKSCLINYLICIYSLFEKLYFRGKE